MAFAVGVTSPDRETCKWHLLACAESPDGWIGDLDDQTRLWASELPMEGLLFALRGSREPLRVADGASARRTAVRTVLLALACKDEDLLDGLADEFRALLPAHVHRAVAATSPRPSLAA